MATTTKQTNAAGRKTETTTTTVSPRKKTNVDKKRDPSLRSHPATLRTKLIIYPQIRWRIFFMCLLGFAVFTSMIFTNFAIKAPWVVLIMPVLSIGALFLFLPTSEEWEYRPWQNAPRKIEQSIFDK